MIAKMEAAIVIVAPKREILANRNARPAATSIIPIAPQPGTPVPHRFAAGSRAMVRIWTGTMTASAANNERTLKPDIERFRFLPCKFAFRFLADRGILAASQAAGRS